ncbi:MAG: secondary thiamine-phosphate synthase enzyme YjbQ [Methanomassiliicoccales archaeon]
MLFNEMCIQPDGRFECLSAFSAFLHIYLHNLYEFNIKSTSRRGVDMDVVHTTFELKTAGEGSMIDLTEKTEEVLATLNALEGTMLVSVRSTTSAIIICENEEGLLKDILTTLENIAPATRQYEHNRRWNDDNGRSHVKASMLGQSILLPVHGGNLVLGQWQSVFLVECDVRPRIRTVDFTFTGTKKGEAR